MAVYKLLLALSCRVIGEIRSSSTLCMCFVGAPKGAVSPLACFSFLFSLILLMCCWFES